MIVLVEVGESCLACYGCRSKRSKHRYFWVLLALFIFLMTQNHLQQRSRGSDQQTGIVMTYRRNNHNIHVSTSRNKTTLPLIFLVRIKPNTEPMFMPYESVRTHYPHFLLAFFERNSNITDTMGQEGSPPRVQKKEQSGQKAQEEMLVKGEMEKLRKENRGLREENRGLKEEIEKMRQKEKEREREWSQVMEEDSLGHRDSCKAFKLKNHILKEPPSSANTYQVKK